MQKLDRQLTRFSARLGNQVGLSADQVSKVATLVAADVRFLPADVKEKIRSATPIPISARLEELTAFQAWMELASSISGNPVLTRAQVIVQNYVCFVYLVEACFRILASAAPQDSVARRCARFLTDNPVRAFRNAVAHANWHYKTDFSGLEFWARKGSDPAESLSHFEVSQEDLDFWQSLSRAVAYAVYTQLDG